MEKFKKFFNAIKEWVDDNIVWWCYYKPRGWYRSVRHWFYCNWNIEHWRLVKQAFLSYPWDGNFSYELEERQIDKQIKYFSKHQRMVDEQYEQIMRTLRLAKYLVHIINTEANEYWYYEGEPYFTDVPDNEYLKRLHTDKMVYHYTGPRINKNNLSRYLTKSQLECEYWTNGQSDHEIYLLKCKRLYHKVREYYTDYWWD